ncbi:MAG: InlB B-repeat-containing protein [Treponema sp.]|nr:InlB B-repeat-containing protein [Treponema sp.]
MNFRSIAMFAGLGLVAVAIFLTTCTPIEGDIDSLRSSRYTVSFNTNGGEGNAPPAQTIKIGSSIILPNGSGITKDNYIFGGWNTKADGTGDNYSPGSYYVPDRNVTLYAKWNPAGTTFTVDFNTDDGIPVPAQQIVESNGKVTQPDSPAKTGYSFGGWYKEQALITLWDFGNDTVTENIMLYAKWIENQPGTVNITFITSGGTNIPPQNIPEGGYVNKPDSPTREGYIFDNWYADDEYIINFNFSIQITADQSVYAKWNPISYTVRYNENADDADGSTADSEHTYDVEKALTANGFTRDGFAFTGWALNADGTGMAYTNGALVRNLSSAQGDIVTLYAKWEADPGEGVSPSLSITPDVKFDDITYGDPQPQAKTVTITNTGGAATVTSIKLFGEDAASFTLSGEDLIESIESSGEASFMIQPVSGLGAGSHSAVITVIYDDGKTATTNVSITVAKANPTITTWPVAVAINFGAALSTSALTGGESIVTGSFAWTNDYIIPEVVNSGYSVTFTPEDTSNYNTITQNVSITVNPKEPAEITLTVTNPSHTLIPFGANGIYRNSTTFSVNAGGLSGEDTVVVIIKGSAYGLELSNNTISSGSNNVTITYDGTTPVSNTDTISVGLTISANGNYTLSVSPTVSVDIIDGQVASRPIPVTEGNIVAFNTYANSAAGLTRHYKLMEDVELDDPSLGGSNWTAIGSNATGSQFTGSFNGNGHVITNLTINNTSTDYQGMFGYIGAGGMVQRVGLEEGSVKGKAYVGGIAGYNKGTVQNCYNTGDISGTGTNGEYIGGIAGRNEGGTIKWCYATGNVDGQNLVGGITGSIFSETGDYGNVYNSVALNTQVTARVGGIDISLGRVVGSGTNYLGNNFARNNMSVLLNWDGSTGIPKSLQILGSYVDGADVIAGNYEGENSDNWWIEDAWFEDEEDEDEFKNTGVWIFAKNNLPKLKTGE